MIGYTIRFRPSRKNRFVEYKSVEGERHLVDEDCHVVPGPFQGQLFGRKWEFNQYAPADFFGRMILTVGKNPQDWGQEFGEGVGKVRYGRRHSNMVAEVRLP